MVGIILHMWLEYVIFAYCRFFIKVSRNKMHNSTSFQITCRHFIYLQVLRLYHLQVDKTHYHSASCPKACRCAASHAGYLGKSFPHGTTRVVKIRLVLTHNAMKTSNTQL